MTQQVHGTTHTASEWGLLSGRSYADPFNEVEVDVLFTGPKGREWRVPAYWAGGQEWRVRFSPPLEGAYTYTTVCTDAGNTDLHGREGTLEVSACSDPNPLLKRGSLRVSEDRRHLQHADGTPFLWLGDTWWMGLCKRVRWPDEFQWLTADRKAKGFSVVQIVAGPYPEMQAFDPRNENEAGQPWEPDWARVNPAYYDMADLRIRWLVKSGLVPCILSCWGYYLPWMGVDRMKKHWRNLIARYGAYPVVWCLAGETAMPFYCSKTAEVDTAAQKAGWTEMARYVRETDPYGHPITTHPTQVGRDQVDDDTVLDFDMLQTGHDGYDALPGTVTRVRDAIARKPRMPVVNGEVCYEGIFQRSWADVQRLMFWSCMLSGACGYTYGANGLWQANRPEEPFGAAPHGPDWGGPPWEEAARLAGSTHVGVGRRILERYEWWRFEPHPEWVRPDADAEQACQPPYAAGIPRRVRMIYLPPKRVHPRVFGLEPDVTYTAVFVDPMNGAETPVGKVTPDEDGMWKGPVAPTSRDWLLVLSAG